MKTSLLEIVLLLLLSARASAQAQEPQFPPAESRWGQSTDLRPAPWLPSLTNLFSDLTKRLEDAVKSKDLSAIMSLYQTNGVPAAELASERSRWQHILAEGADGKVSMFGKELATLPSEEARTTWSKFARNLTKRPVTHIVMVTFGQGFQLVLPLVSLEGRLWIVPSDKKQPRSEPDGAAKGSQPIRSETNRTSSAAGSRR